MVSTNRTFMVIFAVLLLWILVVSLAVFVGTADAHGDGDGVSQPAIIDEWRVRYVNMPGVTHANIFSEPSIRSEPIYQLRNDAIIYVHQFAVVYNYQWLYISSMQSEQNGWILSLITSAERGNRVGEEIYVTNHNREWDVWIEAATKTA